MCGAANGRVKNEVDDGRSVRANGLQSLDRVERGLPKGRLLPLASTYSIIAPVWPIILHSVFSDDLHSKIHSHCYFVNAPMGRLEAVLGLWFGLLFTLPVSNSWMPTIGHNENDCVHEIGIMSSMQNDFSLGYLGKYALPSIHVHRFLERHATRTSDCRRGEEWNLWKEGPSCSFLFTDKLTCIMHARHESRAHE